jgi:hypothetical protein
MKTAADNKTVRLDINADMDASALDALLHKLALDRANMTPAIPNSRDAAIKDGSLATIEDGQSGVIARRRDGGFRLWLRHSGFGWLAWEIDDRFASGIANYIAVNTVEAEKINLITQHSGQRH